MSRNQRKRVHTLRIVIGETDEPRRKNLIKNMQQRVGKAKQSGKDVVLSIHADNHECEYIEYRIKNLSLDESL